MSEKNAKEEKLFRINKLFRSGYNHNSILERDSMTILARKGGFLQTYPERFQPYNLPAIFQQEKM